MNSKKYIILEQFLSSGINFLITLFFARVLGIKLFGEYSLIIFTTYLFLMLSNGYIGTLIMTKLNKSNMHIYIKIIMLKFFSLFIIILFFVFILDMEYFFNISSIQFCLFVSLFILNDIIRKIFMTITNYKGLFYFSVIFYSILLIQLMYEYTNDTFNINNILESFIIGYCLMHISFLYYIRRDLISSISSLKIRYFFLKEKSIIFNLTVSNFLTWLNQRVSFFVQNHYWGSIDIGIVNAYLSLLGILNPILILLENYLLPKMITMKKEEGITSMINYLEIFYYKVVMTSMLFFLPFFFLYEDIISYILGAEYLTNQVMFLPLLCSYFFVLLTKKSIIILNVLNSQEYLKKLSLIITKFILPVTIIMTIFYGVNIIVFSILIISIVSFFYLKLKVKGVINE